jgi:Kef-type K+ transport system membrane component KefB
MTDHGVGLLLIAIAIVILTTRVAAMLLVRIGQPPVIAEIIAGIALGPTLLGALPGDPSSALFTPEVREAMVAIGTVGLVVFVFLIGLELDGRAVRQHERVVAAISAGAVIVPFALGFGLAIALHEGHSVVRGERVPLLPFALFLATAMSITAFPVLTRIIVDRGIERTRIAQLATASAAVQDLAGWLLLAVSLTALTGDGLSDLARTIAESVVFVTATMLVVKPLLRRWLAHRQPGPDLGMETIIAALALLAACAGATQLIGLHAVLGAFVAGIAFPRERVELMAPLREALSPITLGALLPVFFVGPGLATDFGTVAQSGGWEVLAILACAVAGKLIGVIVPARATGATVADATALGVLLNTRGLMELIVLNVGLTNGVLDQSLFSSMVLMTLVTTMMTGPLLDLLARRRGSPLWEVIPAPRAPVERQRVA